MEFGKVRDPEILAKIKWKLPAADPLSISFLEKSRTKDTELRIGAPAWNHKEWLGKIYPLKTKAADYLYHYSRYFNTIELNTTHYRIPTKEQTKKWCGLTPPGFLFCPKIFQGISHERGGLIDPNLNKAWLEFLENLGPFRGPSFLQLPPTFDYGSKALLFKFLQNWPSRFELAIELRHPSWFHEGKIIPALTQYLQTRNIGLIILDVAGRRDLVHSSISADFTMIRFIGNSLHASDYERAQDWNEKLNIWSQEGLSKVFFFVHQPDDIFVPEMTEYLGKLSFFESRFSSHFQSPLFDQSF